MLADFLRKSGEFVGTAFYFINVKYYLRFLKVCKSKMQFFHKSAKRRFKQTKNDIQKKWKKPSIILSKFAFSSKNGHNIINEVKNVTSRYAIYDTLIDDVTMISNGNALIGMIFNAADPLDSVNEEDVLLYDSICELNQYFFGQRKKLDIKLYYQGSPFEIKVYDYVRTIPYGETKTYEEVAEAIGEPNSTKAVINALSHNPIPVFIPDHRVIGNDGNLVSYCSSLELKKYFLDLEKKYSDK